MFNYLVLTVFLNSPFVPADLCGDILMRTESAAWQKDTTHLVPIETRDCNTHKWQKKWILGHALVDNYTFVPSNLFEGNK